MIQKLSRKILYDVACTNARHLGFLDPIGVPQLSDMLQPEVSRLYVEGHPGNPVRHIRIILPLLLRYRFKRIFVSCLGTPQKSRGIMRREPGLPRFVQILARPSDQILGSDKDFVKAYQVADGGAHSDGIPPDIVEGHARVTKLAG